MTVNNQIVIGTLMNLADNPTKVSIGQSWRESDITNRVPIIVTGNDFSTLYAPLIRDGRMDKFYWLVSMKLFSGLRYIFVSDFLSFNCLVCRFAVTIHPAFCWYSCNAMLFKAWMN